MPHFYFHTSIGFWASLHWLRHDLYSRWTFTVFIFIGLAQAGIGWESGELAVTALTKDLISSKERKRSLLFVRILAFLLLPATVFVGVVNDMNQKDADAKSAVAIAAQGETQRKLDESNGRARRFQDWFDVFVRSLDPSKFTVAQYAKFQQAQNDASRITPTPTHQLPRQLNLWSRVRSRRLLTLS